MQAIDEETDRSPTPFQYYQQIGAWDQLKNWT